MVVAPMPPVAGMIRRQKQIVARFQAAGATSADHAVVAATLGVHEGLAFKLLRRGAVLQEVGDRRFYLDASRWQEHQNRRRRLALICSVTAAIVLIGIVFWATYR